MDYKGLMTVLFPAKAFKGDDHFKAFASSVEEDKIVGKYVDHWFIVDKNERLPKGNKAKRKTYILTLVCDHHIPKNNSTSELIKTKQNNVSKLKEYFVPFFQNMLVNSVKKGIRSKAAVRLVKYDVWEV